MTDEEISEIEDEEEIESEELEEDIDEEFDEYEYDTDEIHVARQKPVLDDATKDALKLRKEQASRTPTFRRQEWFRYKRLSRSGWKRPKGIDSSQRHNLKYRSALVRIGHRKVKAARGLHPSGFRDVLVHKPDDLEGLNPETEAARIGSKVGNRKRELIHERADELGLRILNRRDI